MVEKKEFDFWQDHSSKYLEMALSAEKRGILEQPDVWVNYQENKREPWRKLYLKGR